MTKMLVNLARGFLFSVFLACLLLPPQAQATAARSPYLGSGAQCAACTMGVGIVVQLAQVHNETVAQAFQRICQYMPDLAYQLACEEFVNIFSPLIIALVEQHLPPDYICTVLHVCQAKPNKTGEPVCHLFPLKESRQSANLLFIGHATVKKHLTMRGMVTLPPICDWPGISYFCALIDKIFSSHLPAVDLDGDGFSSTETLRGYAWRGRDCIDLRSAHYPGAKPVDSDKESDSNCNGISGVDESSGEAYEKLFCEKSGPLGVVLLGDSAGAHFHIPDQWLHAPDIDQDSLSHLPYVVANEFDWPMMSGATGYTNISWSIVEGTTKSIYQLLRERNRCNHRDYQNLGINGADSSDALKNIFSLRRNQTMDQPVLLVYEFVGNDVCNRHNDTIANMTTVTLMKQNVVNLLDILEESLPRGSHVLMMGLADGRLLYDSLYDRYHPIGRVNKDVKYPDFYNYLSCLEVNPCNGWMTSNATLRDFTSQRAWELSQVIKEVVQEKHLDYKNFDVNYIDCPLTQIYIDWELEHGPKSTYQLIETVDGFHPNQISNKLFAEYIWVHLEKFLPHYIGDVNPNNQRIVDIFGEQGGH